MLCPAGHVEAKKSGLVLRCDGRRDGHHCDGPRTPYIWKARDNEGKPFDSMQPCCGSCVGDEEDGYYSHGPDERCCCIHGEEGSAIRGRDDAASE